MLPTTWKKKNGEHVKIVDMSDAHILRSLGMLEWVTIPFLKKVEQLAELISKFVYVSPSELSLSDETMKMYAALFLEAKKRNIYPEGGIPYAPNVNVVS